VSIKLICGMFAAIIDKLGGKIHSDKRADSKSDNDEEKKWRGYSFYAIAYVHFLFLG